IEVHLVTSEAHLAIELGEDRAPDRAVGGVEEALDGPGLARVAARLQNGAQRGLQRLLPTGLAANLQVGLEEEERAAPVGGAPGSAAIEAVVAWLRQTLRQ